MELEGYLLPGGQTITLFDVKKFTDFIARDQEIWIIINHFQGKLKKSYQKEKSPLIKYLPNTIFYDL